MKICPLMLACLVVMVTVGFAYPTDYEMQEREASFYNDERVDSNADAADEAQTDENFQHTFNNHFYPEASSAELTKLQNEVTTLKTEVTALNTEVTAFKTEIANSPVKLSGCHTTDVGYTYKQRNELLQTADTGELNSLNYNKKRDDTVLLITYSNNIRTAGIRKAARWYVKVDGRECSVPSRIDMAMYQSSADNTHIPGVLMGVCQATAAGRLSKGAHRISIHVGPAAGVGLADAYTGWRSSSLLEVKEMCPSY